VTFGDVISAPATLSIQDSITTGENNMALQMMAAAATENTRLVVVECMNMAVVVAAAAAEYIFLAAAAAAAGNTLLVDVENACLVVRGHASFFCVLSNHEAIHRNCDIDINK
jgi:hypothetical protein